VTIGNVSLPLYKTVKKGKVLPAFLFFICNFEKIFIKESRNLKKEREYKPKWLNVEQSGL
jgi:hypothetical protein